MELTRISDLLFGRRLRLPLLLWVHEREEADFFQKEATDSLQAQLRGELSVTQSAVRQELDRLAALGLVIKMPRLSGADKQFYRREATHPLWTVVRAAQEVAPQEWVPEGPRQGGG